ncbi:hypothetical protein GCM10010976_17900 [Bizionia arctica]|uniref:Uncharacterized protein n=2 Tax=Bizionia arctica TaxID=1495645 RepID=A0A917LP40_9FLAO|nr:hypothetical protein GCM10010976_17900 [Bizionia arctica]
MIICCQNNQIKEIVFEGETTETNRYVNMLKLKDQNALIIQIGYSSYPIRGLESDLVVYMNNGQVRLYKISEPINDQLETKVKRVGVKKSEYKLFWKFLNTCISQDKFNINKPRLNFEDANLQQVISGGKTYHFRLYQNKKYITYSCFLPNIDMPLESTGFEEKQRLVALMEDFESIIKNINGNNTNN